MNNGPPMSGSPKVSNDKAPAHMRAVPVFPIISIGQRLFVGVVSAVDGSTTSAMWPFSFITRPNSPQIDTKPAIGRVADTLRGIAVDAGPLMTALHCP
jgi:hypothetical protein